MNTPLTSLEVDLNENRSGTVSPAEFPKESAPWKSLLFEDENFRFQWDFLLDRASLIRRATDNPVWRGSLLPALSCKAGMVRPAIREVNERAGSWIISLDYEGIAAGRLEVGVESFGISFRRFELAWVDAPVALLGLYIGASELDAKESLIVPEFGATHWPDWRAEGFCVPGAKTNPGQSFWRFWDMGHAVLPLGSFGPAMGTPYTAAFPRPVLAAAMGGPDGWFVFGPGAVPDAALSLDIRASSAWLRYWMREDLWGAPAGPLRVWEDPLRLTWHEDAWAGFSRLYRTFPECAPAPASSQQSLWCTWGNFKEGRYDLENELRIAEELGVEDLQLDDGWETWVGSGVMDERRFPRWKEQEKTIRSRGVKLAYWEALGWVARPDEAGLSAEDLLCGPDGRPRLCHWGCDPRTEQPSYYGIDPASPRAREYLEGRTRRVIRDYRPALLKVDFGYGMPGPDGVASRDPAFRGERLCLELLRIVTEAARAEDTSVSIEYYGIHPLFRPYYDVLALDDLGDMGTHEIQGHHQRSVWAALVGAQGAGIMASSGYYWSAIEEILLNTAILGAPGGCQPNRDAAGGVGTPRLVCRFRALSRWHRRTTGWEPLWLNSHPGNLAAEPQLHCWGRLEAGNLTALALRESAPAPDLSRWGIVKWTGRWALFSLDENGLDSARTIVCVPFDAGSLRLSRSFSTGVRVEYDGGCEKGLPFTAMGGELRIEAAQELDKTMGFLIEMPA